MSRPPIAVVVATLDRPAFLDDALRSIAADLGPGDAVVVAAAGTSPALPADLPPSCALLPMDPPGKSRQLNAALAATTDRTPILVFTDDDCRVPAGWLDAMAAPFADATVAIGFGPVAGLTHVPGSAPEGGPPPGDAPAITWTYAHGAAMAVRRTALVAAGGFDERLGPGAPAHGEEHDLLLRLRERGGRAVVVDAPPVQHLGWRDADADAANALVYERGSGAFLGAALRRAPAGTARLLAHRLRYQAHLFGDRDADGRRFGPRALRAFAGGVAYGLRLDPWAGRPR